MYSYGTILWNAYRFSGPKRIGHLRIGASSSVSFAPMTEETTASIDGSSSCSCGGIARISAEAEVISTSTIDFISIDVHIDGISECLGIGSAEASGDLNAICDCAVAAIAAAQASGVIGIIGDSTFDGVSE
jgi:hypothetical protein